MKRNHKKARSRKTPPRRHRQAKTVKRVVKRIAKVAPPPPEPRKYNTVVSDTVVDVTEERRVLDALSACVLLTPAEEERIMPSRIPSAAERDVEAPEEVRNADDFAPDIVDDAGPESDADLVHAFMAQGD